MGQTPRGDSGPTNQQESHAQDAHAAWPSVAAGRRDVRAMHPRGHGPGLGAHPNQVATSSGDGDGGTPRRTRSSQAGRAADRAISRRRIASATRDGSRRQGIDRGAERHGSFRAGLRKVACPDDAAQGQAGALHVDCERVREPAGRTVLVAGQEVAESTRDQERRRGLHTGAMSVWRRRRDPGRGGHAGSVAGLCLRGITAPSASVPPRPEAPQPRPWRGSAP